MKPRQRAVLRTVRRWVEITFRGFSYISICALCDRSRLSSGFVVCALCPYVEVFETKCYVDFPSLENSFSVFRDPHLKLRRALELAKQYGLQREALAIVRKVVAEMRGG